MELAMIVACDEAGGIGKGNTLPWDCPEDMQYFKEMTKGATVVMGYNTYKSLPMYPKGLPGRRNVVVVNIGHIKPEGCGDNVEFATKSMVEDMDGSGWLIGGAKTYLDFIQDISAVSLTVIPGNYQCDTGIPIQHFIQNMVLADTKVLKEGANPVTVALYMKRTTLATIKDFY